MPEYSIKNTLTGEEFCVTMSYKDLQKYLKKDKNLIQIFSKINVISGTSGLKHTPEMRKVFQKVKEAHPHSTIDVGNKTEY